MAKYKALTIRYETCEPQPLSWWAGIGVLIFGKGGRALARSGTTELIKYEIVEKE